MNFVTVERNCLTIVLLAITSSSVIYFKSEDLGPRLCLEKSQDLKTCLTADSEIWEISDVREKILLTDTGPDITLARIYFKSIDGVSFDMRFKNGKTIHNVLAFLVMGEEAEVDIDLMNNYSANYSLICMSKGKISEISSSLRISAGEITTHHDMTYPNVDLTFITEIRGQILQSGSFTCHSGEPMNTSETLNIFTQISGLNYKSPFVVYSEMTIQSAGAGNGFIVPCRTNYRMERPPDLLWKKLEKDNFTTLTAEEMQSFKWDPLVGFQFNSSERMWEMEILACQSDSFKATYLPTSSRFKTSVFVTAAGELIACALGRRRHSQNFLLASESRVQKKRHYRCDASYTTCNLLYQTGVSLIKLPFEEFDGNPSLVASRQFGVVSCFLEHSYEGKLVPEISHNMFFFGLDSNVHLLPGSYPNSSIIQINRVTGPFYKSQAELYYQFTCTRINFILFSKVYLILRYHDKTETIAKSFTLFLPPAYSSKVEFNVSLETNISHAICLCLTQDGKVVSAERVLQIFDAFAPLVDNAASNSRHLKVGELNNDFTLTCPITGGPPPQYRWIFDSKSTDLVDGLNTRYLTFRHIHENLTGIYTCKAWNRYGNSSFKFQVSVPPQEPPSALGPTTISLITFAIVILFLSVVAFSIKYFRAKRQIRNLTSEETLEFLNGVPTSEGVSNHDGSEIALHLAFTKRIQSASIVVDRSSVLGKGQFGVVYRGFMHGEAFAVKTFKRTVTFEEFRAGLLEVKLMHFVGEHPNIVKFIGADVSTIQNRNILVVMELSPIGSLEKHLRMLQPSLTHSYANSTSQYTKAEDRLTFFTFFGFCEQLAFGMEHLENKRVIHGDLAARNVLVFNHGVVKLTDFGYSRQLYEKSMYTPKKNRALPWRWASIELLRRMEFSTESDVWAFGVTVWEIFTFGDVPFARVRYSDQFLESLEKGLRLEKPSVLTEIQYQLLKQCWNYNKFTRPRFSALRSHFLDEKNNLRLDFQVTPV